MASGQGFGRIGGGGEVADEESASEMTKDTGGDAAGWKTTSVSCRAAENGFIVSCSKERAAKSEKSSYEDRYQSKDYAFSTAQEALAYLTQELGSMGAGSSNGANVVQAAPR